MICALGNKLYFAAGDPNTTGVELHEYDGTNTPTLVKDIVPGIGGSNPEQLLAYNGKLYFTATTSFPGTHSLYSYDPVTTNVTMLSTAPWAYINISAMIVFNNMICMSAATGTSNYEFWSYNPANNTFALIKEINPGSLDDSKPRNFTILGNKLYFIAKTQYDGNEIFSYDGTTPPQQVTTHAPGSQSAVSNNEGGYLLNTYNSKFVFGGNNGANAFYYQYDPATQQTTNMTSPSFVGLSDFFSYDLNCYFSNTVSADQTELYRLNSKTQLIEKLTNGVATFQNLFSIHDAITFNNALYFAADADPSTLTNFDLYKFTEKQISIGIQDEAIQNVTRLYPNPSTGNVTVSLPQQLTNLEVVLTDIKGSVVYRNSIATAQTVAIPLQHLQPAIYVCSVKQYGKEIFSGQVVKQ
jgi:ELWxxDGT repeat protein